jgi:hypothetical protein
MVTSVAAAEHVAELYQDAELAILEKVVAFLAEGIETPGWAQNRLARLQAIRGVVLAELNAVHPEAAARILAEVEAAYAAGGAQAVSELSAVLDGVPSVNQQQAAAVRALASAMTGAVIANNAPILGFVEGAVRQTVEQAIGSRLTGGAFRRAAVQAAIDNVLGSGLTAIQLPSGRKMGVSDYVNLAVRTGTANASRQGHASTLQSNGLDLVVIQPGPRACPICDRFARQIMSLNGSSGQLTVDSVTSLNTLTIDVMPISEAISLGLEHPNCRCRRRGYLPGATDPKLLARPPFDAEGYAAQQRQRDIERAIRRWKTKAATQMDPQGKAQARQRVQDWQAVQRRHMAEHPYLKRQSVREQI